MVEFLKHFFGFCGEPHPSVLTILMGTPVVGYMIYNIRQYIKGKNNDR